MWFVWILRALFKKPIELLSKIPLLIITEGLPFLQGYCTWYYYQHGYLTVKSCKESRWPLTKISKERGRLSNPKVFCPSHFLLIDKCIAGLFFFCSLFWSNRTLKVLILQNRNPLTNQKQFISIIKPWLT